MKKDSGQVLISGVIMLTLLLLTLLYMFDVHNVIRGKLKLETGQQAAALAGAAWQKNSLNLIGEINLFKACSALLEGDDHWTHPLPDVPEDKNDPVYEMMAKSLKAAAEYSASRGSVLAVETGPEKAETLCQLLDDIDSKGIGVNLDPANLRMVACVDAAHAVKVLGRYIVHTHAKDGINIFPGSPAATYGIIELDGSRRKFAEERSQYKEVPLGEGQVEWDPYLAALKEAGFDGFLTIERECGEDPEGDILKAYNFLKSKIS